MLEQRLAELNQLKIDLGLDRLKTVIKNLDLTQNLAQIITVGGTNGKGSTVAALCSLLKTQADFKSKSLAFGAFTSPHIFKFNERFNINGRLATDDEILKAFEIIDAVKAGINLSYFEYAFLTAVLLFKQHEVDVMVLEVGLGGRLDAVNALDADACVITTVDLDHTAWLGDNIESIAEEKAGIMRADQPVVYGDVNVPESIKSCANKLGARLIQLESDYQVTLNSDTFDYQHTTTLLKGLKRPKIKGDWQVKNFSSALTVLLALGYKLNVQEVQQAIDGWHLPGRLQTMQTNPLVLADVAHNRQAVKLLAQYLKANPIKGQTRAVFSVLADKQLNTWLNDLDEVIDHWFIFELAGERALDMLSLKTVLADHVRVFSHFDSGQQAYDRALQCSESEDRIIVFGSFHVLEEVFGPIRKSKNSN